MPRITNNSKYRRTSEFIYTTTAAKLKERKLALRLTDSKIAGEYDRKVISRIVNNTRTRNNAYLIPPTYVSLLVRELGFENDVELFWGNLNDEIYIEKLFLYLLLDILDERDENADIVKQVLIDDVRYARIAAHAEYISPEGDYLPLFSIAYVNNGEQFSPSERDEALHGAILRLFESTRPIQIFRGFFEEKNSYGECIGFSKLDRRLDKFVNKSLVPFLKDSMPGADSLGLRVYSIIKTDITDYGELEYTNASLIDSNGEPVDDPNDPGYYEILRSLLSAGAEYIAKVEQVQRRLDELNRKSKAVPQAIDRLNVSL